MVKPRANSVVRLTALCLLVLAVQATGTSGCLINPKDYPLAMPDNGGDGGQAEAGGSADNRAGTGRGGTAVALGGGACSVSSGGSAGRSSETTGAGGTPTTTDDAGGEAGELNNAGSPTTTGGSGGNSEGVGGAGIAGTAAVGAGGPSVAGGGSGGAPAVKRVFVTRETYDGNFKAHGSTSDPDGLKGANTLCNAAAEAAGLGGAWIAWLSVTGNDAINRVADVAPWYLIDQTTKVFDTHAQLASPANVPVNATEYGDIVSGPAWTGTTLLGTAQSARCGEWKNNGTTLGAWGDVGSAFDWSYKNTEACSTKARLYCFEQ